MPLDIKPLPQFEIGEKVTYEGLPYTVLDNYGHESVYVKIFNQTTKKEIAVCRLDAQRKSP